LLRLPRNFRSGPASSRHGRAPIPRAGGFRFEHQFRHVHLGGHSSLHIRQFTQVSDSSLISSDARPPGRSASGGIRLGTRRRSFFACDPKDRTHPPAVRARAAIAATRAFRSLGAGPSTGHTNIGYRLSAGRPLRFASRLTWLSELPLPAAHCQLFATPRCRLGSGPMILPGFRMFFGSKIRFTSRNTDISGPACRSTHGVRAMPVPCCVLTVPPREIASPCTARRAARFLAVGRAFEIHERRV